MSNQEVGQAPLKITRALSVKLGELESFPLRPLSIPETIDSEASDDYYRGIHFWNKRLKEDVAVAADYFQKAIQKDPNYAAAYGALANCYIVTAATHADPHATFGKAREAAEKAISLDDKLASPHIALAYIKYGYDWDWDGAEKEYKRALALDPENALAHHWYAIYLTTMKRFPEAMAEADRAIALDPLSQSVNYNAAVPYYIAGKYDDAARRLQKAIALDPSNPVAYGYLGQMYGLQGHYREAAQQFEMANDRETEKNVYLAGMAGMLARAGERDKALRLKQIFERTITPYKNPYAYVTLYSGFGERDKVIEYLAAAVKTHACGPLDFVNDRDIDFVRSDPRFAELAKVMNLPLAVDPVAKQAS
jgi:Tfp pilus assembly protein PilF